MSSSITEVMANEQKFDQVKEADITLNPTAYVVEFTENDGANPLNWRQPYKWLIVILVASLTAVVYVHTRPIHPQDTIS